MRISSPVPFGASTLNSSPLDASGSDFPCKLRQGVYDITQMNNIAVGVPQELSFIGGATHGGGSCQVSVTLDKEPTPNSKWKVVHSIIGGCPSDVEGNASGDPQFRGTKKFKFTLPTGMPNGQYTLAWTWLNKIGNREFYMNCAPIQVTGGADNNNVFNSLPDMFVANLPPEKCATTEGQDFAYPNPGESVEIGASAKQGSTLTGPGCGAMGRKDENSAKPAAPASGSDGSRDKSSPATTPAPSPPSRKNPGGVFAPAPTTFEVKASPVPVPSENGNVDSGSPAPQSPPQSSNGSVSDSGLVPCPTPGLVVCVGSDSFAICNTTSFGVPQKLAAGTQCVDGVISGISHLRLHRRRALARHVGK